MVKRVLLLSACLFCIATNAQTPDKDLNWEYTDYSDEFESGPLDESKWLWILWGWPDNPAESYPLKENIVFHHDAGLNEGIVTLTGKRENYYGFYKTIKNPNPPPATIDVYQWYSTTCGILTTNGRHNGYNSKYGYFEMKYRLQDNINWRAWDDGSATGGLNRAFWVYTENPSVNVKAAEIDFTETLQNDDHQNVPGANIHTWPQDQSDLVGEYAHCALSKMDGLDPGTFGGHYKHQDVYYKPELTFNGGWHIIGCEWLPNQINWYLDGKLLIKLPGDYIWEAGTQPYSPVEFLQKAPLSLIIAGGFKGADLSIPVSYNLEYDIAYVRIYRLRSTSSSCQTDISYPNYDFCTQYLLPQHTVYKSAVFGQNGCTNCSATFSSNCRVSVRAKESIRLEDGFSTVNGEYNGEFFANDVDCSKF